MEKGRPQDQFFNRGILNDGKHMGAKHHKVDAFEKRFLTHIKEIINVFAKNGNPFEETDLVSIGSSKLIASVGAVKYITEEFTLGLKQYDEFVMFRFMVTAKIFDKAAVIHMLYPGIATTFSGYYKFIMLGEFDQVV